MSLQSELLEAAKAEQPSTGRVSVGWMLPIVQELRAKRFTYDAIYDWFRDRGVVVQKDRKTFRASVSKRIKKLEREAVRR